MHSEKIGAASFLCDAAARANMSIRQLAVLGRRAVSYNLRIVEGPAVLRNRRHFSGKVLSEEEKAGENIFIKVSHQCAEQIPAFESNSLRQMVHS